MSAGETLVRVVAISAVVALLAPMPETPDASKRQFGEAGVAACTGLIEGANRETNVERRIPLILARALHRIEAKDYAGVHADIELARKAALEGGLADDHYFKRSVGISLERIEAAARIRMGDVDGARAAALGDLNAKANSYVALSATSTFPAFGPPSEGELRLLSLRGRFYTGELWVKALRLVELRRFGEAADIAAQLIETIRYENRTRKPEEGDTVAPMTYALLALTHAVADRREAAQGYAVAGRERMRALTAEGKPPEDRSELVELFDFFDILSLLQSGDVAAARRQFGARSQWVAVPAGFIDEAHRRLSEGITPDQCMGLLTKSLEDLAKQRRDDSLAQLLETDRNNRTLFTNILPYAKPDQYEGLSRRIWNVKNSSIKSKKPLSNSDTYILTINDAPYLIATDALSLHAALVAKANGKKGFVLTAIPSRPHLALVRFADLGEPGVYDQRWSDADAVIAALGKVFPSPEQLSARRSRNRK
jgi:hypothetical protein